MRLAYTWKLNWLLCHIVYTKRDKNAKCIFPKVKWRMEVVDGVLQNKPQKDTDKLKNRLALHPRAARRVHLQRAVSAAVKRSPK